MTRSLQFSRVIDLPRVIVWDALVDRDLLGGWLAEPTVEPVEGGDLVLRWSYPEPTPDTTVRVERLQPPRELRVSTDDRGDWRFVLDELDGGTRGTSTALVLTVEVEVPAKAVPGVQAWWEESLDNLENVLRGHPVDWLRAAGTPYSGGFGGRVGNSTA